MKKQIALGDMAKTARKMLADEEISIPDDIVMNLISDDAETTKSSVESFAKSFKDAVQAAVKNALRGDVPKSSVSVCHFLCALSTAVLIALLTRRSNSA